jgi:hypothetical protein
MATRIRPAECEALPGHAPLPAGSYDLASLGYAEEEYRIAGDARSFVLAGDRNGGGHWGVEPGPEAPFVSRFVVRRPIDPKRFSGTVIVEWNNVSGGIDIGPDWTLLHRSLTASGHVWVGVTAQKAGIDGGGLVDGLHLKLLDPGRYADLQHPGDAWSYDIFTQVGELWRSAEASPLGELRPHRLIAMGESQSAAFLVTYINAIDPEAQVFDGYLVHGRGGSGAGLDGFRISAKESLGDATRVMTAHPERIRDDARVPVLVLQSETDVVLLGGGAPLQPDGEHLRLWEIAGAAHADTYLLVAGPADDGSLSAERMADLMQPTSHLIMGDTETPINSGPQQHYVGQAALDHLVKWVSDGTPPPGAPRLVTIDEGRQFAVGEHGIALGGIRTPWVDVPTATLTGLGQTGQDFAFLFGRTVEFDASTLESCYPGGREEYLQRFTESLDGSIAAGYIRAEDRHEILALASAAFALVSPSR